MRLCYITGSFPPYKDGVGDFAWHVSNLLPELGYDEIMLVVPPETKEIENFKIIHSEFVLKEMNSLIKQITAFEPQHILIEYPCLGYGRDIMINLLPAMLKITNSQFQITVTIHEYADYTWKGKVRVAMMSLAADKVMVTDKWNAKLLKHLKNNVYAVLPVPPQIPLTIKKDYNLKNDYILFSYWGFIRENKGLHLLIPALKKLLDMNIKAKLKILAEVGNSEYDQKLAALIKQLELTEYIEFTGYLDNDLISRELSESDVCVLPFTDGISDRRGTLKAALAMGIPVISTMVNHRNLPDGILSGINILLSEPDDSSLLQNMIKCVDRDLRRKLGSKALQWSSDFNWQNICQILEKVLIKNENTLC
jgi:glycosyltransferase involved in cell wall biosynthesis